MKWCYLLLICLLTVTPGESSELIDAVKMGRRDLVQSLIAHGADISETDENGMTPLMWAAERCQLDIVTLVDAGYQPACRNRTTRSSMWQSESVYGDIVRLLLNMDNSTHVEVEKAQQRKNQALIQALINGNPTKVRDQLNNGANPNARDRGRPVLAWAAFWGQEDIVKILLTAGADANRTDANGFTALMLAEEYGHEGVVALLKSHESSIEPIP